MLIHRKYLRILFQINDWTFASLRQTTRHLSKAKSSYLCCRVMLLPVVGIQACALLLDRLEKFGGPTKTKRLASLVQHCQRDGRREKHQMEEFITSIMSRERLSGRDRLSQPVRHRRWLSRTARTVLRTFTRLPDRPAHRR